MIITWNCQNRHCINIIWNIGAEIFSFYILMIYYVIICIGLLILCKGPGELDWPSPDVYRNQLSLSFCQKSMGSDSNPWA